jgi:hypothetical protein
MKVFLDGLRSCQLLNEDSLGSKLELTEMSVYQSHEYRTRITSKHNMYMEHIQYTIIFLLASHNISLTTEEYSSIFLATEHDNTANPLFFMFINKWRTAYGASVGRTLYSNLSFPNIFIFEHFYLLGYDAVSLVERWKCSEGIYRLHLQEEDGDRRFLRNVGNYLSGYTLSHPRESNFHSLRSENLKFHIIIFGSLYTE